MNVIFLGPPDAGKGTQAVRICERLGIPQISTGEIFRENLKRNTPLGREIKEFMEKGELVPDDIVLKIVEERLSHGDCAKGFILDGFPRTIPQAEALDKMLAEMGIELSKVISIEVKDEDIVKRMSGRRVCKGCGMSYHIVYKKPTAEGTCDKCGESLILRDDDKPEVVLDRLKVYYEKTAPLKDYYKKTGKLVLVEGQEEVADTTALVNEALKA
mgnify:CR=1 FL=1